MFLIATKITNNYPYALELVPECYKTHKTCDKGIDTYPSTITFASEWVMIQEMYGNAVFCN